MAVFPKVDAASPRGLMAPPGLTPLGAKGSACDRLRHTGRLSAAVRGLYRNNTLGGYGALRRHFVYRLSAADPEAVGF